MSERWARVDISQMDQEQAEEAAREEVEQFLEEEETSGSLEELEQAKGQAKDEQVQGAEAADWTGSYALSEAEALRNATRSLMSETGKRLAAQGLVEGNGESVAGGLELAGLEPQALEGAEIPSETGDPAHDEAARELAVLRSAGVAIESDANLAGLREAALLEASRYLSERDSAKLAEVWQEQTEGLSWNGPQRMLEALLMGRTKEDGDKSASEYLARSLEFAAEDDESLWMAAAAQGYLRELTDGTAAQAHALELEDLEERQEWLRELEEAEEPKELSEWAQEKLESIRDELESLRERGEFEPEREWLLERAYRSMGEAAESEEAEQRQELVDQAASAYGLSRPGVLENLRSHGRKQMEEAGLNPNRARWARLETERTGENRGWRRLVRGQSKEL